jgi:predicted site-specific integrase-resolvase
MSLEHAAAYADVSVKTIKRWIESGLPKYQAGPRSKVLIRPTDIETFLIKKSLNGSADLDQLVEGVARDLQVPVTKK